MSIQTSAQSSAAQHFQRDEDFARHLDSIDPLRDFRQQFHIPRQRNGDPVIYFCGNSLGLQPQGVRKVIEQELGDWEHLAVDAHFKGHTPWYSYHEALKETGARLVGGRSGIGGGEGNEVVMMNSLTINLHLMLATFFQPTNERHKILIEDPVFPSDLYAIKSHLRCRGLDPAHSLAVIRSRRGAHAIQIEDLEELLDREGGAISLVMLAGVNFFTGQALDMARITALGHKHGCIVGFDLAHAAGNIPLHLHDWNVDFAVWCSYKYLNAGPGAVGGCFVHQMHGENQSLPRLAGWWGNDPDTRFRMHLIPEFFPRLGADGWQVSNPPILSMAPLRVSLDIFDEAGMERLRAKSLLLTSYLRFLVDETLTNGAGGEWEIMTPQEHDASGCQLSFLIKDHARRRFTALQEAGVICDFREPNVIRIAPVPLYNTFHEVWSFAQVFRRSP